MLALPFAAVAYTPPLPPPDPARVQAARDLVEQLPIEDVATAAFSTLPRKVTDNALAWLGSTRPAVQDDELRRLFATAVEQEARLQLTGCVPQAEEALAQWYARGISAADLREITAFASSQSGRALNGILSEAGDVAAEALVRCAYERIFPKLPAMLDEAIESDALRRRVNQPPAGA